MARPTRATITAVSVGKRGRVQIAMSNGFTFHAHRPAGRSGMAALWSTADAVRGTVLTFGWESLKIGTPIQVMK